MVDRQAEMGIGDRVAIRGDLRPKGTGRYTPDQLADGKYVKHCDSDRIWTGLIKRLKPDEQRAQVGGMWYPLSALELVDGMDPERLWPDLTEHEWEPEPGSTPRVERWEKKLENIQQQALNQALALTQKIREELFLPFCRRHRLTYSVNPYGCRFYTEDGEDIEDADLHQRFNDPEVQEIQRASRLELSVYHALFDQDDNADIKEEDL